MTYDIGNANDDANGFWSGHSEHETKIQGIATCDDTDVHRLLPNPPRFYMDQPWRGTTSLQKSDKL